jgi:hypothetical protein
MFSIYKINSKNNWESKKMKTQHGFIIACAVLLSACAAEKMQIKTYDGELLSPTLSALMKPTVGVVIKSIDGKSVLPGSPKNFTPVRPGMSNIDAEISFKEGPHLLEIGFFIHANDKFGRSGTYGSEVYQKLEFNAVAGRKYVLKAEFFPQTSAWSPKIIDVSDSPEVWCSANDRLSLWTKSSCKN